MHSVKNPKSIQQHANHFRINRAELYYIYSLYVTFSTGFLGAGRLLELGGERLILLMLAPVNGWVVPVLVLVSQLFQSSKLIMDIATYRLNQPWGQCSENHVKCITRWEGRDGVTITIFFQHTRDGHEISYI